MKSFKENEGMPLDSVRRKAFNDLNYMVYNGILEVQKNETCFCGGSRFEELSRLDRYGLPFGTQICHDCGLITQTISLTDDSMPVFYDKIYWPLNHGDSTTETFATDFGADEFAKYLTPEIRKRFTGKLRVIEIGCGQGDRLARIRKELESDYDVTILGTDYSTETIQQAAKRNDIIVQQGGVEVFFNAQPADVIILSHLFEHVVDLKGFISQIEKISHPDTLVYVEVPGVLDLKNKPEYEYNYQDYCVVAHIHNFSLSTLINVFLSQGLIPIKGTEFVRLIVSKKGEAGVKPNSSPYGEIMQSLQEARQKHEEWYAKHNAPLRKYVFNLLRAVLGKK